MRITDDMKADRDWLVQTLNRTMGGDQADAKVAWTDLREAGWCDVFDRIAGTWKQFTDSQRPTNRLPFRKAHGILSTCGMFQASQVMAAIEVWVQSTEGQHEPDPAALFGLIAGRSAGPVQNAKPGCRPESRPEVLSLVADLIGRGVEDACNCHPRPSGLNYVMDDRSVIYCPVCAGIEQGQATEAEYHAEPFDDGREEPQSVSAVVLLRRARLAKRERLRVVEGEAA